MLAESRKALEEGRYAVEHQAQSVVLHERIASLGYSREAHDTARRVVQELQPWEEEHRRLQDATDWLPKDETALQRAQSRLDEAAAELERLEESRHRIGRELEELPGYRERLGRVGTEQRKAAQTRGTLQERRGLLAHQLEELERAEMELKQHRLEHEGLLKSAGVYAELAQAPSARGAAQALLVEAATPRLEDEANRLLTRMTDGRMSLKLETQWPRRTSSAAKNREGAEPIETLEILIADELGTREL